MAYTIRDFGDGFYVTTVFRVDPAALPGIENALKLNDNILRFLLVQASEQNIKAAVQRLQQQQAPATPPVPQSAPSEAVPSEGVPAGERADASAAVPEDESTSTAPVDAVDDAPVVPPVVAAQPVIGTEEADAASATTDLPNEPEPEPVTASPASTTE